MTNIIDSVESIGKYSFAEKPFTKVDSLVLLQLAYLEHCNKTFLEQLEGCP